MWEFSFIREPDDGGPVRGFMIYGIRFGGTELNVFVRRTNRDSGWHRHIRHDGWSWVVRGGYVEESAESLLWKDDRWCIPAEDLLYKDSSVKGRYLPAGPVKRIQVRAPCIRRINPNHRVRGDWISVFVHVYRNQRVN